MLTYCCVVDTSCGPAHADKLGYGKVILLFRCRIQPTKNSAATTHDLAFIEELWPYTPPHQDIMAEAFGCSMFYSVSPHKVYYVISTADILAPAAIMRDPVHPTIPYGGLRGKKMANPDAKEDSAGRKGTGSCLYRLNVWAMKWGTRSDPARLTKFRYGVQQSCTGGQAEEEERGGGRGGG